MIHNYKGKQSDFHKLKLVVNSGERATAVTGVGQLEGASNVCLGKLHFLTWVMVTRVFKYI